MLGEIFLYAIAKLAGSVLLVYLLTRFFRKQFVKTISEKNGIIYSTLASIIIIGLITYFTMGLVKGIIWYLPGVIFWLIYDLIKLVKKERRAVSIIGNSANKSFILQIIIIVLLTILIALQFIDLPVIFRYCEIEGQKCSWHYLPMDRHYLWRSHWGF